MPPLALRLIRSDVLRLDATRRDQVLAMLGSDTLESALEQVSDGTDTDDERMTLVYLRVDGHEGWFIDWGGPGSKRADLDGGCFFRQDTVALSGLSMSQQTWVVEGARALHELVLGLLPNVRVATRGAKLDARPTFEQTRSEAAAARDAAIANADPLPLCVLSARRYTERQIRHAPLPLRWLYLHSLRREVAVRVQIENIDRPMVVDTLYGFTDRGTGARQGSKRGALPPPPLSGLVHLVLGVGEGGDAVYEGFFWDARLWPSPTAKLKAGLLFEAGTVRWTGVEVSARKITTTKLESAALRAGLEALGRAHPVVVEHERAASEEAADDGA